MYQNHSGVSGTAEKQGVNFVTVLAWSSHRDGQCLREVLVLTDVHSENVETLAFPERVPGVRH